MTNEKIEIFLIFYYQCQSPGSPVQTESHPAHKHNHFLILLLEISYLQTRTKRWSLLGPQRIEDILCQELFQFRLGVGRLKFAEASLQIIEIFIIHTPLEELESAGHIRLDGVITRSPTCRTDLRIG